MSKLDELIAELCPDGVEHVKIKDVAEISVGGDLPKSYIKGQKFPTMEFPYPIYSNGIGEGALYGYANSYKIEKEAVTISARGTIGYHVVREGKFTPIVRLITLLADESKITTKFLNYALYVAGIEGVKTGIPSLTVPMLEKFKIPLPPLPVQREVVRILDNFTELTAKLTAELTARKKQYEYYRDMLLTFGDTKIQRKKLGEVCLVKSGGTPLKSKLEYWEPGTIKWLGSTVCKNQKNVDEITNYISNRGLEKSSAKLMPAGSTLIALVGATIGKVAFLSFEAAINQNIAGIYPLDTSQLNPSFLYYACTTLYNYFTNIGQGKLAMANLSFVKSLKIPIPPMEEQERIVAILDRFDTLCNDLSSGLPAEIEARRKQYEYYRDKLLTFKEKKS